MAKGIVFVAVAAMCCIRESVRADTSNSTCTLKEFQKCLSADLLMVLPPASGTKKPDELAAHVAAVVSGSAASPSTVKVSDVRVGDDIMGYTAKQEAAMCTVLAVDQWTTGEYLEGGYTDAHMVLSGLAADVTSNQEWRTRPYGEISRANDASELHTHTAPPVAARVAPPLVWRGRRHAKARTQRAASAARARACVRGGCAASAHTVSGERARKASPPHRAAWTAPPSLPGTRSPQPYPTAGQDGILKKKGAAGQAAGPFVLAGGPGGVWLGAGVPGRPPFSLSFSLSPAPSPSLSLPPSSPSLSLSLSLSLSVLLPLSFLCVHVGRGEGREREREMERERERERVREVCV